VRVGKRGPFISCGGYPKCRATLPAEKLDEYQKLAAEGKWPPQEVLTKLNISPAAVAAAQEAADIEAQKVAEKAAARAAKKKAAPKKPAKPKAKKVPASLET
jgi:ssDNA-binding Zn-finger/Zn-ribbon topoisomerase 1